MKRPRLKLVFTAALLGLASLGPAAVSLPRGSASEEIPSVEERLEEAARWADQALEAMGLDLPEVVILPGVYDARAVDGVIEIGERTIASHDTMTLAQILMHEAGHVVEGHSGIINQVMEALVAGGLLTPEQRAEILRNDELVADAYAAIGSWLLEPGVPISSFSEYMAFRNEPMSETHPDSATRMEWVEAIIDSLSVAEAEGVLSQAGLEVFLGSHANTIPESNVVPDAPTPPVNEPPPGESPSPGEGGGEGEGDGDGGGGD